MNLEGLARRTAVLGAAMPPRILVVDDGESPLVRVADRLASAGFDVVGAVHSDEALRLCRERWFPVIIVDGQMLNVDGSAFAATLRTLGHDDSHILMLEPSPAAANDAQHHAADVSEYIGRRVSETELLTRVRAAFDAVAVRPMRWRYVARCDTRRRRCTQSLTISQERSLQRNWRASCRRNFSVASAADVPSL